VTSTRVDRAWVRRAATFLASWWDTVIASLRRQTDPMRPLVGVLVVVLLVVVAMAAVGEPVGQSAAGAVPPSAPASPLPAASSAPPTTVPRTFTVLASGDILLHDGLWAQAKRPGGYDFGPLFAHLAADIRGADLAICHLETPLAAPGGPFGNYPLFNVPPQVVTTLADVGYDTCSTASNHSLDQGQAGISRTLAALDAAGIRHTGTARNLAEARRLNLMTVHGAVVAQLSYTFSFNGLSRPAGKDWVANYLTASASAVLAEARRARAAGAEIVIVSLHWGTEYSHDPNDFQRAVADRLLASPDVDLIVGHHAHVVQPLQRLHGKWVAYGMGNEVAWQNQAVDTRDGIMPLFTFTETKPGHFAVTRVEVIPIHMWLDGDRAIALDVPSCLRDQRLSAAVHRSCQASLQRTRSVIYRLGAGTSGVVVLGASDGGR
jgi:poly-gamma-glutamate capsule biosynthesis protein CapA/YwtB (metallophosphatase superfamily)